MAKSTIVQFREQSKVSTLAACTLALCVAGCRHTSKTPEAGNTPASITSAALKYAAVAEMPPNFTYMGETADGYIHVNGVWLPDSDDPKKQLMIREQAMIDCNRRSRSCTETTAFLQALGHDQIDLPDLENKTWQVNRWDEEEVLASIPVVPTAKNLSDRCRTHTLTFDLKSGRVFTADILVPGKGCEIFSGGDTYVLQRGHYYVQVGKHQPCLTKYGTCIPEEKE